MAQLLAGAASFYGDTMLAPESEEIILDSALGLLAGLRLSDR